MIKMVINDRSPTMRHVSKTHRVALEWLFDRMNLDPKIQNRYIDTKHQLADMLTKGNFTRDDWNKLLYQSFQLHLQYFEFQLDKLLRNGEHPKEEERVVSQSRPTAMNLSSFIATSSSTESSSMASTSPGMPIASGKPDSKMSIEPNSFVAASTSQMRLKDAYIGGLMEEQR